MIHPLPHPAGRPVRVLFVFAWLAGGDEENDLRLLARSLDPARHRLDALPSLRLDDAPDADPPTLVRGASGPRLGGEAGFLDIIGVNHDPRNQWLHGGPVIGLDHPACRPLSDLLFETYARYQRPIFVSETGVEDDRRAPRLRYVAAEVARARQHGVPVEGLCR